jgi:glycosyltransferase involved in cell wall biosynthesis
VSAIPSVSVVIPTYNRASVVTRAVRSVLAQTHRNFEILVVDDGSTDETAAVVSALRDDRIRYLPSSRQSGASAARNRGIDAARGDVVAFVDSDDEWLPEKLELQLARLRDTDPRTALVYCRLQRHDDLTDRPIPDRSRQQPIHEGDVYWRLLTGWHPATPSLVIIRRDALRDVGGFDTALYTGEDYDLWLRLGRAGHWFAVVDEALVVKHERAGLQLMRNPAARRYSERLLDQRWAPVILSRLGPLAYRRWLARRRLGVASAYFDRACTASIEGDRLGAMAAVWHLARLLPASRPLLLPGFVAALLGHHGYRVVRRFRRGLAHSVVVRVHVDGERKAARSELPRRDPARRPPRPVPGARSGVRAASAPPASPEGKTFVFICGLHRSGTSLLFEMLREHPQISGFRDTGVPEDEGQHLQSVYPPAGTHGLPGRFGFKRDAHLTEASPLVSDANRAMLFAEWAPRWDGSKPFLLEKSPPNLIRTRFLQAMFPNSKFVVFRRHPIPVSLATRRWSRTRIFSLVRHWVVCHETWRKDRPRVRNVLELTYEHLVAEPADALEQLCAFLGADPFPCPPPQKPDPTVNAHYMETWRQLKRHPRGRLSLGITERVFESRIRSWGYSFFSDPAELASMASPRATAQR